MGTIINENQYRDHSLTSQESDDQSHLAIHFCHHYLAIEEIEFNGTFKKIKFFQRLYLIYHISEINSSYQPDMWLF